MSEASASRTDGDLAQRLAAALGPASACVAAVAVALGYLPNLYSIFAEPKLALFYVAGAVGFAAQLLLWAEPTSPRVRLLRPMVGALVALIATTVLAALVAIARGAPGAPYASLEIVRFLAVGGVALSAARAAAHPVWRRRLLASIHVAAGLVSVIGLLQHLQILPLQIPIISVPGSTFGNRNIAAEAVAMSIPFGLAWLALAAPRAGATDAPPEPLGPIVALLALELIYLGATRTRGAWLGAVLGIAVFYWLRRRALPFAALGIALALGVAALVAALIPGRVTPRDVADAKRFEPGEHVVREALDPASPVVRQRVGLWQRTLAMYRAHPLLGVGPGNFQVFFPLYAEPGARADGVLSATVVPRRPHQDLLERLAETGPLGLGALLAVYVVGLTIAVRRSRRADAPPADAHPGRTGAYQDDATVAAAAAGSLMALFACGLVAFPLEMPATALLFGFALGFLAYDGTAPGVPGAFSGAAARARSLRRPAAFLAAAALVAGTGIGAARGLVRSYWLAREHAALHPTSPDLAAALAALRRAERASPGTFDVALETAYVLERLRRFDDSLAADDRALAVEPHSANAWFLRAQAALGRGDAHGALDATDRALAIFADYPDALVVRAFAETRLGHADAARAAHDHLFSLAEAGDARALRMFESLRAEKGPP